MNRMIFTAAEREAANNFIKALLDFNVSSDRTYNDMHIYTDDYNIIVDWMQEEYAVHAHTFVPVNKTDKVASELTLPDNSTVYVLDEAGARQAYEQFLSVHPEYMQDEDGNWYIEDSEE